MTTSKLLYDASTEGLWFWWLYPSFLPFPIIGGILARRIYRSAESVDASGRRTRVRLAFALFALSLLVPGALAWNSYSNYRDFHDRLARGDVIVVQGTVQDFVPQSADRRRPERFRIGDNQYELFDNEYAPGYHTLRANGGVITDGLVLRLAEIDGRIARIELIE